MKLTTQRRLAAEVLGVGEGRIWIDPERLEDVEVAMTREDVRKLIKDGAIRTKPEKGISRGRKRVLREKKKKGRRRGLGSRKGAKGARAPRKELWMSRIRALRKRLRELRARRMITASVYRKLYLLAKGGAFRSVAHLEQYIEANKLYRRR